MALSLTDLIVCLTAILHFVAMFLITLGMDLLTQLNFFLVYCDKFVQRRCLHHLFIQFFFLLPPPPSPLFNKLAICEAYVFTASKEDAEALTPFLAAIFSLTTLILRVSVFINVLLIVVRTINITRPFYQINKKRMWIAVLVCPIVLLPVIIYDAIRIGGLGAYESKIRYVFLPYIGDHFIMDIVVAAANVKIKKGSKKVIIIPRGVTFITSCAPFIVAVIISIVCLGINWRKLARNQRKHADNKTGPTKSGDSSTEREITITIAMLTAVFSICNTVYTVFLTFYTVLGWDYWDNQLVLQLCYVTSTVFPFISSALNSVILIWRSKNLRESLKNRLSCTN